MLDNTDRLTRRACIRIHIPEGHFRKTNFSETESEFADAEIELKF